jgi:hypothetical protein
MIEVFIISFPVAPGARWNVHFAITPSDGTERTSPTPRSA